jgi:hypothetical protein
MERLVGNDFEAGLANLKTLAERQSDDVVPRLVSAG